MYVFTCTDRLRLIESRDVNGLLKLCFPVLAFPNKLRGEAMHLTDVTKSSPHLRQTILGTFPHAEHGGTSSHRS